MSALTMTTGNFPQDLRPGIRMWFGLAYENYATEYDKILDVKIPEDRAYEEDVYASGLGLAPVKPQGAPVSYDAGIQEYSSRYPHIQYGLGFVVTEEMLEDGIALKKAEEFSRNLKLAMLRTRETVAANVLNNAFTTTMSTLGNGQGGGDGASLCSASHPTRSGNQSNVPTSIVDLSEAGLEQAMIDIQALKDSRGLLIRVLPEKLIISPTNQFQAERILKSPLRSGTNDNDLNAMNSMGMLPGGTVVNHYLTGAQPWFIKTNQDGANFFNRKDITLKDDNEFDTNNAKFKGQMRFSVGWSDWRSYYGVNAT